MNLQINDKVKIGDTERTRVVDRNRVGKIGTVTGCFYEDEPHCVRVDFADDYWFYNVKDVELISFPITHSIEVLLQEHEALVARTSASTQGPEVFILNGPIGLAAESGELLDLYKKQVCHGHPNDAGLRAKKVKELGDIMWYFRRVLMTEGISLEEVLQGNIDKLNLRYPSGFSTAASIARADTAVEASIKRVDTLQAIEDHYNKSPIVPVIDKSEDPPATSLGEVERFTSLENGDEW